MVRPFRVIVIEADEDRTTTFVIPLERTPDDGSVVELPQGQRVIVRQVLSGDRDGLAGIVLAAPAAVDEPRSAPRGRRRLDRRGGGVGGAARCPPCRR